MRLRAVDLHGYKSFATRATLQFDAPVTAIVGPNGSGKSNIMDALRWVIGAGSGRTLRAKRAEDVVFSGGRDRAPSGFAEVRAHFDNSDHWLDLDAAEVEILRRVHRDGQSEVRVNGRTARLRDVQDLFRSGGLGAGGFALMSQGLVDEMLRLRPHERRQAIEEVGGVRQHRHRMEESRRRRQRAQEDLARARLLRDELAPRLRSLERSARRARRLADLEQRLETAQSVYFQAAAAEVEAQLLDRRKAAATAARARAAAEQRRETATNTLATVERENSVARRTVDAATEQLRTARSKLRSLEHQQELDQQQRSWLSREVQELASRLPATPDLQAVDLEASERAMSDVTARLSAARSERNRKERAQTTASAQHERALAEIKNVRTQAAPLVRRWKANAADRYLSARDQHVARRAEAKAQAELERAEGELRRAERRLAEAREATQRQETQRSRFRQRLDDIERQIAVLTQSDEKSDTLRAIVRSKTSDDVRADAVFGELMDAVLCHDLDEAVSVVERALEADAGRVTALVDEQALGLIDSLFAAVDFVDDPETAKRTAETGHVAVTAKGIMVRPDGVVHGGSRPGANRLRQQLTRLRSERDELDDRLRTTQAAANAQQLLDGLELAVSQATACADMARRAASESRLSQETIRRQRAAAMAQQRSDAREVRRLRQKLERARRNERESAQELDSIAPIASVDISQLERERDRRAAELAEARVQADVQSRARADRARLTAVRRELADVETAIRERAPQLEAAELAAADTSARQMAVERLALLEHRRAEAASDLEQGQRLQVLAERQDVEASAALRDVVSDRARRAAEAAAAGISIAPDSPG